MIVRPFRGLRPRSDLSDRIPSYPYDVIDSQEARRMAAGDPHTFLHVIKAEIDVERGVDPYDDRVYATAAKNFHAMIDSGWLVRDEQPAYYVYRLTMDGLSQTGILGAAAVDDYERDRIKKHEHTRPEKEQDRIRLNETLDAHPGPVFLTYRGLAELDTVVNAVVTREPDVRFTAIDRIDHELWVVAESDLCQAIESSFGRVPCTYVADGHHRAAAAAKVAARRVAAATEAAEHAPYRYFLAAHFPADQLRVLDYNRVVADLNGLYPNSLIERLEQRGFDVEAGHLSRRPPGPGRFGMYVAGVWYLLTPTPETVPDDVVGRLDVSVLTDQVLLPILGVGDLRTDERVDFVGGIRGMDELERRVDSGEFEVAFALHPTKLEQVMEVADSGEVMPPKSTWFEPKLRSGLVVQLIDGDRL